MTKQIQSDPPTASPYILRQEITDLSPEIPRCPECETPADGPGVNPGEQVCVNCDLHFCE